MIDSHCHLDRLDLSHHQESLSIALDAARSKGVEGFLCIGIGFEQAQTLIDLQGRYSDVWLSLGVHPLGNDQAVGKETIIKWCSRPEVIAIGETGLDYHYQPETRDVQIDSFRLHLEAAAELSKPLIVHTRAAAEDTLALMREHRSDAGGILHCFTESWEMAEQALDMGYYVSISGIVTFKNAENVRSVAAKVPLDRLLIETDSPYLAPVPFRGKPNEPVYLPKVAECLAELRGIPLEDLVQVTTENFHRLFPTTAGRLDQAVG